MKIKVVNKSINEIDADIKLVLILKKSFEKVSNEDKKILEKLGFKGENEESCLVTNSSTLYIGCDDLDLDSLRTVCAKAYNSIKKTLFKHAGIELYSQTCPHASLSAMIEGFILGSYEHTTYKSKKNEYVLEDITISVNNIMSIEAANKVLNDALIIASSTNYAKEIVNTHPDKCTPDFLAKEAMKLCEIPNVTGIVYDEKFLKEQNMGAFLAVNRASVHPPRLIHMTYKPKNATKKIIFVGKGLTYDSGGLSLKGSDYMVTMKADKSGGVAAISILKGAAQLGLPFEIHAIVGATENMLGGNAYKPDDVLVAKNGTTIEVRNTDAEGRLVLADCLCYAQEQNPDILIDLATLTGACVVALGEYTVGLMGHNEQLKTDISKASKASGELIGNLPFNKYLGKLLKSNVADISNISSSRYGGAITAGLFLDNFIQEEYKDKWLHLDIAGPAYIEKDWGYNQAGASGAGIRMCLYWLYLQANTECA